MPSAQNSYPQRAYRRRQKSLKDRRRMSQYSYNYDTGYVVERKDNKVYLRRVSWYKGAKRELKLRSRRAVRRARNIGSGASYRKHYDLWWNLY